MYRNWPMILCALIGVLLLYYLLIPEQSYFHTENRMETLYVGVNQNTYATYPFTPEKQIELSVHKGDLLQISLIENPILPYNWNPSSQLKDGFKLRSHQILKPMPSQPLLTPREELRYDRSVFEFECHESGEYAFTFLYLPENPTLDQLAKAARCSISVTVQ